MNTDKNKLLSDGAHLCLSVFISGLMFWRTRASQEHALPRPPYNSGLARRRFFVDAVHGGAAELVGDAARHLTRVLRVEPGQRYEISDGSAAWLAEIAEARGPRVVFRVIEPAETAELAVHITLCAALIKFDRLEWMIEKVTELGVERIQPVETARSEKGLLQASAKRAGRWVRIAREAAEQSRRLRAPEILPAVRLETCLKESAGARYRLEEDAAPPLPRLLAQRPEDGGEVRLLVGPEGGWTDAEREAAGRAGWQPASLGPRVLRAETAAMAAVAVVASAFAACNQYNEAREGKTAE
jgi:16S rRNA (uracil1498-N3)-methyltransferase